MEIVLINDAIIPTRASKKSTGLDLYSSVLIFKLVQQIK